MLLEVEFDELSRFNRFVQRVNRAPIVWTVGLMIPVYAISFSIAFVAILIDPHMYSPFGQLALMVVSALLVMLYHWFFSRYQTSSNLAQVIQFSSGLLPVIGGFIVFGISYLSAFN